MASAIVDAFRRGVRTPAYALAMVVALVPISAFVAQDLWQSIGEMKALESGAQCGQAPPPCTTPTRVTLQGPFTERRDALVTWWTVDDGDTVGDVRLLPSAAARADLQPGPATAYVVDGNVVAVGDRRVPTAMSGSHAVFVDGAGLMMSVPLGLGLLHLVVAARRSGAGWADPVAPRRPEGRAPKMPPGMALVGIGGLGFLLTVRGGLDVGQSVATTLVVAAMAFTVPRLWRRWRRATTKGRHAAF